MVVDGVTDEATQDSGSKIKPTGWFFLIHLIHTAQAMKPISYTPFQWVSIRVPLKVRHLIALIALINMKAFVSHCILCWCHMVIYSEKSSSWDTDQKHRQQRAWRHADMLKVSSAFPQTSVDTRQAADRGRRKPSQLLWYKNTKFIRSVFLLHWIIWRNVSMTKRTWN